LGKRSNPLVSVVIPAYNGARTILRTVSSVLGQEGVPFELIVIDDGSRDSTGSLVESFVKKSGFSGKFNLVNHKDNLGLSASLNDAIQRSTGDFILILHQDCEFVGSNWMQRALSSMNEDDVAIVTGYYGISDAADESFVKRAFGVLRKQFHSRPEVSCEEVTFSEGKCDLYRLSYLLKVGGFPEGYRIAGEDLVVSYKLRGMGLKILKCYDLEVVQRFSGAAETFSGNLRKEFLFGKVTGGVFYQFKLFLFKGLKSSKYSGSRSLHRAGQPFAASLIILFSLLFFLSSWWFGFVVVALIFIRWLYYVNRVYSELRGYANHVTHSWGETLIIALIGILTDFSYSFGFLYGSIRYGLGRKL
jgi:glycosyltransferase involved in cell wall biosynthesis